MKLKYTKPSSAETLRTSTRKTGALLRSQHTAVAGVIGKTVVSGILESQRTPDQPPAIE
jgi:hypothetical protein